MNETSVRLAVFILLTFTFVTTTQAQSAGEKQVDLYSLLLAEYDLKHATRQMTLHDLDEDGYIDAEEQDQLRWKSDVAEFDLNRDKKLTHLEIAVRHAKMRTDQGIEQFDINNATRLLRQKDTNGNGQLDPDELDKGGWPPDHEDYDRNNDGIISEAEAIYYMAFMRGLRRELGIEAVDHSRASKIVGRFDADKDRKLGSDEYSQTFLPEKVDAFDGDRDGKLDVVELATMFSKHRRDLGLTKPDQSKINAMFSTFDMDMDGNIAVKDLGMMFFADNRQERYKEYDTDKDGVITMNEVEKQFAAVRKERGYIEVDFDEAVKQMKRHDTNRSKHIEKYELEDSAITGKLSKAILKTADRNGDERISLDELSRHFAKQRLAKR